MSKTAISTLVAQSNCPICGSRVTGGGGGVAFAAANFACGCELQTANGEIVIGTPCPAPSYVAVRALNETFASEMPTPPGNQIRTAECDGEGAVPVTGQLPVGTASNRSLTCQCSNTITDPCIVCGKGKTLVTAEWLQKMALSEGDLDCTTGSSASRKAGAA